MKKQPKDCGCLEKVAENIERKVKNDNKDVKGFCIIEGGFEHKSWYPFSRLYSNYIVKSEQLKKDGTLAKPKNSHINIFYSYCPFCGKEFKTQS